MSAALRSGTEGFLARYEGLRERLPGEPGVRQAAAETFRRMGLPGVRDEAWKYTNLRALAETEFRGPASIVGAAELPAIPAWDGPRLVFVNGQWRADLSAPPDTLHTARFAEQPGFVAPARAEPIAMLNTMLAEDGAVLSVAPGIDAGTVLLVSLGVGGEGGQVAFHPRHSIRLAEGARLTLVEMALGRGRYFHNPVFEVEVAASATFSHIRLQDEAAEAFHLATLYAAVQQGGTYDAFTLTLGARIARAEFHARLLGPNATAHLNAAQLLGGSQLGDVTTVVAHEAPNCASRQTVKNVLGDRARGVFQGRIEVARVAQKTDGYQMSQALLLSPEAEVDCKPELQIYADDVKCSHGATIGELDEEQLFYLRARGIPQPQARSMLVRAFLDDALDAVSHEPARALLEHAIDGWWQRRSAP